MHLINLAIWKEHIGRDGKIISRQLLDICKQFDYDFETEEDRKDSHALAYKFFALKKFESSKLQILGKDGKWKITSRWSDSEQDHYILIRYELSNKTFKFKYELSDRTPNSKAEILDDFYLFPNEKITQYENVPHNKYNISFYNSIQAN